MLVAIRSVSLIPSASQIANKGILFLNNKFAIYASTLALYVYDTTTFVLVKVLTVSDRTISGFDICPTNHNLVVITSIDDSTQVWNIFDEVRVNKTSLEGSGKNLALWNPFLVDSIAIVTNMPHFRIMMWDCANQSHGLTEVFASRGNTLKQNVIRWNPLVANQLAVGFENGLINLYDTASRSMKSLQKDGRTLPVVDLRWDRLSSIYLLAAYTSFVSLWDVENQTEIHTFEKQNLPISSISWMDWTAGNFISTNSKTGVIKVWNASQQQPLEVIKISKTGINSNCLAVSPHSGIFAGVDGSIEVYDFDKKINIYSSEAAHSDTIFDCKFMANTPDLVVTASYDQTIKVWSISDSKLVKTITVNDGIIYNCDTNRKGTIVAAACQLGAISLWDTSTARIIGRFVHHSKQAFAVAWNPHVDNIIASVAGDNLLVVFKIDLNSLQNADTALHVPKSKSSKVHINAPGSNHVRLDVSHILLKFAHPAPVFGCNWSPKQAQFIATGCQDSYVRIFDYISCDLCYQLYGHSARSFNVLWSPLCDGRLASGSDDHKIIVWDINLDEYLVGSGVLREIKPTITLVGHTSNVRALAWNYENKHILLSGSWDSTIRVWNVYTGNCIQVINNHSADVYSIVSHPERPFTYASCSRDTTVRIFELEGVFELMRIKAVWFGNLDSSVGAAATIDTKDAAIRSKEIDSMLHVPVVMSGLKSLALSVYLTMNANDQPGDQLTLANKYYRIFNFFGGSNGCLDIWEGILGGLSKSSKRPFSYVRNANYRVVINADEIVPKAKSVALKHESVKMTSSNRGGELSSKVEEALRAALIKYAQIGEIEKCCSLLIELRDWTTALSIAPCVSMDYYHSILGQYTKILTSKSDDMVIPYMMGARNYTEAIDFYLYRKDVASALVIANIAESRPKAAIMNTAASTGYDSKYDNYDIDNSSKALIKSVIDRTSANFIEFSHPFLAAAQYISINDVASALSILSSCGAYDQVYAVAAVFNVVEPYYIIKLAEKCAEFNDIQLAVTILCSIKDDAEREVEVGLILGKYAPEQAETILLSLGYHSLDYWRQKAMDEEAIGSDVETVLCYILSQNFDKCATIGINYLKRYIQEPIDLNLNSRKLIRYLKYIDCKRLDPSIRDVFRCNMYWFGAHEAAEIALWETSCNMLRLLSEIDAAFIVSKDTILYQELCVRIMAGDCDVVASINGVMNAQTPSTIADSLQKLKSLILDASEKCSSSTWNRTDISRIWGENTTFIFHEMQRMSDELSLPSLSKLHSSTYKARSSSKVTCLYEVKNSRVTSFRPTSQGSKVPVAGSSKLSYVSKKRITGLYIQINEVGSREPLYAAVNEINEWKKILPYIL